jgi:KDO2-lipid IV(A) lauroyltransferase
MQILYKFAGFLYFILFYFFSYRKKIVIQNLSRSFPKINYQEISNITKKFYLSFCYNLVEILKTVSISPNRQADKIILLNFDIVKNRIKRSQNVIVGMGHCGNWEILNILPYVLDLNCYAVYKPLKITWINRFFYQLRSRFNMKLITTKSVTRHILSNNTPSLYFILADQCPKVVNEEYKFKFLNQETSVFHGIEKLAVLANCAVVYMSVIKVDKGLYRIECKEICDTPRTSKKKEITQNYINLLEQNIQDDMHNWLWTHKRWKR